MIYERKQLPELYFIKHRHDNNDQFVDYEKTILNSSISPYVYNNDLMNTWLNKMQPLIAMLMDRMNVVKNFKNYMVDKDDYRLNS